MARRPTNVNLILAVVLFLGALAGSPARALAFSWATVAGKPDVNIYWLDRDISYWVNEDLCHGCVDASEVMGAIKAAFNSWENAACADLFFDFEGLVSTTKTNLTLGQGDKPDFKNLIIWRDHWPPEGVSAGTVTDDMLALTVLIYDTETGVMVDGDIDLNGVSGFWSTTDEVGNVARDNDIQSVLTYEVGHLLGLEASENTEAMMAEMPVHAIRRDLHEDDIEGVCHIYPYGEQTPAPQGPPEPVVQGGCAVAPGGGDAALLLLGLLALLRRR